MRALNQDFAVGEFLAKIITQTTEAIAGASQGALEPEAVSLALAPAHTGSDLSFRCFELAKAWKRNPAEIAREMASALGPTDDIERFEAAGPYLNVSLRRERVATGALRTVFARDRAYGRSDRQANEVVMMEYISPNTNKPLHLGHIRNGVLARAVANLLTAQGAKVLKADIINDRGIHIAKSMIAYRRWGDGATPESAGVKGDHFVGDLYVRFDKALREERSAWYASAGIDPDKLDDKSKKDTEARFIESSELMSAAHDLLQRWEASDEEARSLWRTMNSWVYDGFAATYGRLGIDFDHHFYESEIFEGGKEIIEGALTEGLFVRAENGAVIAPLSEHTKLQDKVVLRADGTGLYITQDINLATIKFQKFGLTRSIYCIASEQDFYMRQLFATLKLLGFPWADGLFHLSYGMVYLPEGKMKSREGTVVDADELMDEMVASAREALRERHAELDEGELEHRAPAIGLAGMTFPFLIVGRDTSITFDPKESISFEGKTGPYLQYAYARCASILRKADGTGWREAETYQLAADLGWQLARDVLLFPCVVTESAEDYDPSKLANYLVDLAQTFSSFYHDHPVLKAEEPLRSSRLALVAAVKTVLSTGWSW